MIKFTEEEKNFLQRFNFDFNIDENMTYEEEDKVINDVSKYLVINCFDENYNINHEGVLCESILDKVADAFEDDED